MGPPLLSRPPGHEKNLLIVHRYLKITPDPTHSDIAGCIIVPFSMVILGQLKQKNKKKLFTLV